ncbi:Lrp/AsnC family transcriptional regulator [Candidatus Bathyarchaeota archaeon]|nr:MAG: Lrp/AsnC family transcriptional regulator [Candidatus Bathyarchaeota archaeon]
MSLRDKAYSDLMRELWGSPHIWNTKKSYIEIAAKLGVDEETVRNRVKHLRDVGFLLGYRVVPNPTLLGRVFASLRIEFRDRESKQAAIPRLAQMDGVINIGSAYDTSLLVTVLADQDQDFPKLIVGLGVDGEVSLVPGLGLRTTSFRMTKLDWEIVRLLLRDAERKLDEIAKQLKVSTRTVKRRLNLMMKEAAILTMPVVDLRKTEGISYQLRVQIEQGKKLEVEKSVVAKIGNVVFRASDSENGFVFGFTGANVAEGSDILEWVKQQPGVKSASMTIAERVVQVFDWIESEVERRLRTMPVSEPSLERKMQKTIRIRS